MLGKTYFCTRRNFYFDLKQLYVHRKLSSALRFQLFEIPYVDVRFFIARLFYVRHLGV